MIATLPAGGGNPAPAAPAPAPALAGAVEPAVILPLALTEVSAPAPALAALPFAASLDAALPQPGTDVDGEGDAGLEGLLDLLLDSPVLADLPMQEAGLAPQLVALATPMPAAPPDAAAAPLQTASLDHKDAATRALRALLFPADGADGASGAVGGTGPAPVQAGLAATVAPAPRARASTPHSAVAAVALGTVPAPALPAVAVTFPPVTATAPSSGPTAAAHAPAAVDAVAVTAPGPAIAESATPAMAWNPLSTAAPVAASAPTIATALAQDAGRPQADAVLALLGSRIQAQLQQGVQQAVIQLEPYMAGTVQLELRHEAGVLRVHLSASHDDVVRQLQGIGESLRQDLATRQFNEVSVQVGSQRQGDTQGQGRQAREEQPPPAAPGRALGESDEAYSHFAAALRRVDTRGA